MNEPMRLLTDKEIWESQQGNCFWEDAEKGKAVAEAQLALDQQHEQERVERIFREIESKEEQDMNSGTFTVSEPMEWWQSLKKQEG